MISGKQLAEKRQASCTRATPSILKRAHLHSDLKPEQGKNVAGFSGQCCHVKYDKINLQIQKTTFTYIHATTANWPPNGTGGRLYGQIDAPTC